MLDTQFRARATTRIAVRVSWLQAGFLNRKRGPGTSLDCSPEVGLRNQNNLLGSIFMRKRSLFTEDQRVRLVELFEAGMGATAASNRLNVRYSATEKLYNRWRLHGRLCLMENPTKTA